MCVAIMCISSFDPNRFLNHTFVPLGLSLISVNYTHIDTDLNETVNYLSTAKISVQFLFVT